jgi:hypothetical protein
MTKALFLKRRVQTIGSSCRCKRSGFSFAPAIHRTAGAIQGARKGIGANGGRPQIAEQRTEAFLLKMPVVGENFGQPFLAHRLHRNAICQAVAFVRPRSVESHAGEKRGPALRNHTDAGIIENALSICKGFAAHRFGSRRKEGEILHQNFIGGNEKRGFPLGRKGQSPPVGAITEIRQRNPVEGVGEKSGHASLLGQP